MSPWAGTGSGQGGHDPLQGLGFNFGALSLKLRFAVQIRAKSILLFVRGPLDLLGDPTDSPPPLDEMQGPTTGPTPGSSAPTAGVLLHLLQGAPCLPLKAN